MHKEKGDYDQLWLLNRKIVKNRKNKYTGASNFIKELEKEQPNEFINFVLMTSEQFHYLVNY